MKKWIGLMLLCFAGFSLHATVISCDVKNEWPLQLMSKELTRNFKILKKQKPPVYYLAYTYLEQEVLEMSASFGEVEVKEREERLGDCLVRVGAPKLDNTHALKGERENFDIYHNKWFPVPTLENPLAFKRIWWNLTQEEVKQAQKAYSQVLSHSRTMTQAKDSSADFQLVNP